jgi:hypothetical protein
MQNVNIVLRPTFNVLSNGALVFAASLVSIMQREKDRNIHIKCSCIQPEFSAYRAQLTGKQSAPFERAYNSGLEVNIKILHLLCTLHLCMLSGLE